MFSVRKNLNARGICLVIVKFIEKRRNTVDLCKAVDVEVLLLLHTDQ